MKKIIDGLKALNQMTKFLILGGLLAILVAVILLVVFSGSGEVEVSVESSLREIITSSQMRTAEYTYNSIAEIKNGKKIKYYVSYKGTVVAGFDFDEIAIEEDGNVIRVIVPDVEILEVTVDPKFDYIFIDEKYDTEKAYIEASEACKKDVRAKAESNETLMETARESAKDTLEALIKPFESELEKGARVEIVFVTEEEESGK